MKTPVLSRSVIISCFLAGCLEMYDFAIFGFFAPILHKNYLGFLDQNTALIITYLLFAVGFVFRPIGSIIFGYIGDVYGRKPALVLSVSLMGTASLIMCFLPTYEMIGVSACYIIALIRIIQGLSVGGEYNGAIIYAIEHTKNKRIGLVGAGVTAGGTLGVLLATIMSKALQNPVLPNYSWRFAFLLGFGLSIVGYIIRKKLRESPVFTEQTINKKEIPLLKSIKSLKTEFLASFLVSATNNGNFYFLLIFLPNYLKSQMAFHYEYLGILMTIVLLILVPIFGWLSDIYNRTRILIGVCVFAAIYNLVFLDWILAAPNEFMVITYAVIAIVMLSAMVGTINVFVIEIFPVRYRFSCAGLSYSLGASVFGGTIPMVAAWIIAQFGSPFYIGVYMSCVSTLGILAGYLIKIRKTNIKTANN